MRKLTLLLVLAVSACGQYAVQGAPAGELARWERQAQAVTITRDDWGVAHIRAPTDAEVVFGMIYSQAEDDFNRVETNFLNAMGRLAEAEGESAIFRDLRMKLFIDPDTLRAQYAASPAWLRSLMDAWADGLNYYLHTHPEVTPRVITRWEPWMALSFSEGSIGGDIERISIPQLEAFYGRRSTASSTPEPVQIAVAEEAIDERHVEPTGSNGFAIAPSNTANGNALLLINPHTSFFFRAEVQMTSDEGLNAYGAVTWGQFFIYQGFNERTGWMHTSSGADNIDEFLETIVERDGRHFYRYGNEERPLRTQQITVPYRTPDGTMAERTFTVYKTHRGPIVREVDGKWVTFAIMHRPVEALQQSFLRTKTRNFAEYRQVAELKANSSNATVYADADGVIAYLHPQFMPRRNNRFDYSRPVDGSDPATDWQGLHSLDELPEVVNPPNGWIQNTNNWPYTAAGPYSPRAADFPRYMDRAGENARGVNALRVLSDRSNFTMESLRDAAYDPYLSAFARLIPVLVQAYDSAPASHPLKGKLAQQIEALRAWDYGWDVSSVPTSLAVFWGEEIWGEAGAEAREARLEVIEYVATRRTPEQMLQALAVASERLESDFGSWRTPWGEINRFQRVTGDIQQPFSDELPSIPVGFTSSQWGSLAAFGSRPYPGTKRYYGTRGNSFVAVVEFGDSLRARAIRAGGQNSDPSSPHFLDQAQRYADGNLREVYFYPSQLARNTERMYKPGQ